MKNPMTPEEMKQAIDDNAAGYNMQRRIIRSNGSWQDRHPDWAGDPLDFSTQEYRRKPELMEQFVNVYEKANPVAHTSLENAIKFTSHGFVKRVRLVEDPTWVEPGPEEKNPWRPIVKGEWPECKPGTKLLFRYSDGEIVPIEIDIGPRGGTDATEWKYAEPEPENTNPWQPIIKGEWPKCKPASCIIVRFANNNMKSRVANDIHWDLTNAIEWKYAEDE